MRTTYEEVIEILDNTELSQAIIEAYIGSANVFVTAVLSSKGLTDAVLAEIEKWITAHMITATRERFAAKEGAGGAFINYIGSFGEGLNGSPYGQMAVSMDTSGTLAAIALRKSQASTFAIPQFDD